MLYGLCVYVHVCLEVSVPVYVYMEDKGELCTSSSIALHFETGLLTEPRVHWWARQAGQLAAQGAWHLLLLPVLGFGHSDAQV